MRAAYLGLFALAIAGLHPLTALPQAPAQGESAVNAAAPPPSWVDGDTDHKVMRLTGEANSRGLYFNENAFTPGGKEMVYFVGQSISVLDMTTFQSRRIIDGPVSEVVVARLSPTVYFVRPKDPVLYAAGVRTGQIVKVATLPDNSTISSLNADETLLAGYDVDGNGLESLHHAPDPNLKASSVRAASMDERLSAHLPMNIFTLNLKTGEINKVLHSNDWINHVQFSPKAVAAAKGADSMSRSLKTAVYLLALLALVPRAIGQVVGISGVLNSTSANEVDGYSATEIWDADTAYYYDAYVIGSLYQDQNDVNDAGGNSPCQYGNGYSCSEALTQSSVHQGSVYTVVSEHYLITYVEYADGTYYNPDQYYDGNSFYGDGGGDPTGTGFEPGGGDTYIQQDDIYLGYTYYQLSTAPPSISSISPSSDIQGASGAIQVQGKNLQDQLGVSSAAFKDNDIGVSVANATATTASLNYSISSTASIGTHQLSMSNTWGESEPTNFTVGYPPAAIQSVSPSVWTAGTSFTATISGSGFGTAPTLTVAAPGVSAGVPTVLSGGASIQVAITVAADAPDGSVAIQVQPGYAGNSFQCGNCNGGSPNGNATATVQAVTPPPTIMFAETNISGTTQSVVAGQQIALSVPTPTGYTIQSESWSFSNQAAITGGFVDGNGDPGTQPSASAGGSEAPDPGLNQNNLTFYWVNPGDNGEQLTYTYTLSNGQQASTTATFNIGGPTGNQLLTATMPTDGTGVQILNNTNGPALSTTGVPLANTQVGITFTANATPPAGYNQSFTWVQLLSGLQKQYINSGGRFALPTPPSSGADASYPITNASPTTTNDTPAAQLPSMYGEGWETFTATTYLMWDPAIPPAGRSSCTPAKTKQVIVNGYPTFQSTPSDCASIPIPLSSVTWHWSGCAINALSTQSNGTTWIRNTANGCPVETLSAPQPAGFPHWSGLAATQ